MATTKVTSGGITDATIATADIADQAITLAKLPHGTSSNDGKFLRANNGADPTFETVSTDLVADTSPQLGGDLDTNSFHIYIDDGHAIRWGANNDLEIYHDGNTTNYIDAKGQTLNIDSNDLNLRADSGETYLKGATNGSVELYYNNSKKLETTDAGIDVTGDITLPDNGVFRMGAATGGDLKLYHDGTNSVINNKTGDFKIGASHAGNINIYTNNVERYQFTDGSIRPLANNTYDLGTSSLRWQNIYTNDLHLSNEGSSNDMDGSWGDWTIQEGESDLFLKNNRSGKKYKFNLTEVS